MMHMSGLFEKRGCSNTGEGNLEEFAAGVTSNNLHYGAFIIPGIWTIYPGDPAEEEVQCSSQDNFCLIGTDGGGFCPAPGTFCGVVGLKQTFGRVSQRGLMVTSYNGDHIGPMTRSVSDSALMLQILAGHDPLIRVQSRSQYQIIQKI
ncbi:MAG: hypothetical protein CM1200mP35_06630 [Chloroflexota bacterium]|nr:MAG: hypothetical protein CM1200mP35_06630 [Chloroflexota bacterium]